MPIVCLELQARSWEVRRGRGYCQLANAGPGDVGEKKDGMRVGEKKRRRKKKKKKKRKKEKKRKEKKEEREKWSRVARVFGTRLGLFLNKK